MLLHPEARDELVQATLYYNNRGPRFGERFATAIESAFSQIQRSPFRSRRIRGDIRRFLVKTFPYGIVYAPLGEEWAMLTLMHLKREPDYWLGRLRHLERPEP